MPSIFYNAIFRNYPIITLYLRSAQKLPTSSDSEQSVYTIQHAITIL